jgi:hypothetical protein
MKSMLTLAHQKATVMSDPGSSLILFPATPTPPRFR